MPRRTLKVASALRLETPAGGIANPRWMALLEALDRERSITGAARAAGLSYKGAWDAVDAMNNLAGRPVVTTAVGGRGGGGASLTAHGRRLLETYRVVAAESERFVAGLNARLGGARRGLPELGRLAARTSARNQWSGTVLAIRPGAVNDEVEVRLAGGDRVVAVITHESTEALALSAGSSVVALVNASSVMIAAGRGRLALSARNQLAGRITRLAPGAVNTEVVVGLRGGNTVAAVITNASAAALALAVGQPARAVFKASTVIVATG